ncbi:inositol monophosphatase family protein [Aquibacillus rhizosphaerae]|uniref:inositol-phosphate phosphatase n=1 Tax=Aquibacillus rhizosphaerae TaxID=3051431 RepID=A0ABT7L9R8_9BACI|nr:inositol monophosphatase family protein [Aquibacillus sp. LR5S19]MDL4841311.1 inositol monophosphatase family protein [Aquibacillus sp. LR5S19]
MDEKKRRSIFNHAKEWIYEAGQHIRDVIDEPLYIDTKSNPNDLVTQMDRNTEKYFLEKIKHTYPDHRLLSEEGFGDDVQSLDGTIWIVDPIDGTMNFVHQKRNFAISIGIYHEGLGEIGLIYNVMEDVLYTAMKGEGAYKNDKKLPQLNEKLTLDESIIVVNSIWACENRKINNKKIQALIQSVRGTRSYGSAALEFAFIAEGIVDGYLTMQLSPWDLAAGVILVNEVGGVTTQANGESINLLTNTTVFSSNAVINERIKKDFIELM